MLAQQITRGEVRPVMKNFNPLLRKQVDPHHEQINDPTRMGTWIPENRGATVQDERDDDYVGMVFDGRNKRGRARWTTRCTVTAADPGRLFEAVPEGTRVTETWTDDRRSWPDFAAKMFEKIATGTTFADFQRRIIHTSLNNLKRSFELQGRS